MSCKSVQRHTRKMLYVHYLTPVSQHLSTSVITQVKTSQTIPLTYSTDLPVERREEDDEGHKDTQT